MAHHDQLGVVAGFLSIFPRARRLCSDSAFDSPDNLRTLRATAALRWPRIEAFVERTAISARCRFCGQAGPVALEGLASDGGGVGARLTDLRLSDTMGTGLAFLEAVSAAKGAKRVPTSDDICRDCGQSSTRSGSVVTDDGTRVLYYCDQCESTWGVSPERETERRRITRRAAPRAGSDRRKPR